MRASLFLLASLFAITACAPQQQDETDTPAQEETPQSDSEWTERISKNVDSELSSEMQKTTDDSSMKTLLCRKGSLSDKIFSLRSFEGRLCDDKYVSGLKVVGGAALVICWDDDLEDFRDSNCAEKALEAYGTSKDSFEKSKVASQMLSIAADYAKKAESATGAGSLPYYAGARKVFCLIPSKILGPASSAHDAWCGP